MSRLLLLLLISGVLACPLRCQAHGSAWPAGADVDAATGGCDCCGDQPAAPLGPLNPPPADSCDCGSCICHGAVWEGAADQLADCLLASPAALPLIADGWAMQPARQTAVGDACWHRCLYLSGRAARIAHQSLLI